MIHAHVKYGSLVLWSGIFVKKQEAAGVFLH